MQTTSFRNHLFLFSALWIMSIGCLHAAPKPDPGQEIAFAENKGNCLACHDIKGGTDAGNIGPALTSLKQRYPDKARLRAQIWDAAITNPNTIMPPYGRHHILSEDEIDKLVDFLLKL